MSSPPPPRLRVAIIGGGIAGMALGAFLSQSPDIRIDLYELKPEIRTIGSGIAVWKRYWDILATYIDFDAACLARGVSTPTWSEVCGPSLRRADIPTGGHDFFTLRHGPKVIPRTVFLDILHSALNPATCTVHTSKRLTHYTPSSLSSSSSSSSVTLHFSDGTTAHADLLVGADGVHSRVRAHMHKHDPLHAHPGFSGQFAYRMECQQAALPREHTALQGFKIWCGKGRHVTSNTMGPTVQITAYDNAPPTSTPLPDSWVLDTPASEIAALFAGWEPDLVSLLGAPETASRWAIHTVAPLPSFVQGAVALLGDAAHAMTPHKGLGAGQGIEDAFVLWRLLDVGRGEVRDVLSVYDSVRRGESQRVAEESRRSGRLYGFLEELRGEEETGEELGEGCDWLMVEGGCEAVGRKAVGLLGELVG